MIIISGGPGSGKTTLINYLSRCGYDVFEEIPRILIERNLQDKSDLLPWVNLYGFARLCYVEMMKQKNNSYQFAFVDRAIGDIVAYLRVGGLNGDEYKREAVRGYHRKVFLMEPHRERYIQDEVRPHNFDEAMNIHREIVRVYGDLGFTVIAIPFDSLDKQVLTIVRELKL